MVRPGMSDGRLLTSYVSSCELNMHMQQQSKSKSSAEYRKFLQENATEIMNSFMKR